MTNHLQEKPVNDLDIEFDFNKRQEKPAVRAHSPLLTQFKNFLSAKKLTPVSVKNYLSDTRQFLKWLKHPPVNLKPFLDYAAKLEAKSASRRTTRATINRKLASLRRFIGFLHFTYSFPAKPEQLPNLPEDPISNLLKNFGAHLKKSHKSKTANNYLSDVKHYLLWATNPNAKNLNFEP